MKNWKLMCLILGVGLLCGCSSGENANDAGDSADGASGGKVLFWLQPQVRRTAGFWM